MYFSFIGDLFCLSSPGPRPYVTFQAFLLVTEVDICFLAKLPQYQTMILPVVIYSSDTWEPSSLNETMA